MYSYPCFIRKQLLGVSAFMKCVLIAILDVKMFKYLSGFKTGNYCPAVTDLLLFTFSLTRRTFVFVEHFPNEGEGHSPDFASFLVPFHPLQRMKLVRLCPPLPRQQTRVYWVHAGLTKSTDFPRTIRKRNKRQRGTQRGLRQ